MRSSRLTSRFGGLVLLYASRLAGLMVAVVFMPLYARLLGPQEFGLAALVLSVQALMVMLDLGMAGLLTRDLAQDPARLRARWRDAERLLSVYFLGLGAPLLLLAWWLQQPIAIALAALGLFWAHTLQNLSQACLIATSAVQRAALLQSGGVLLRALLTVGALTAWESSLRAFVFSQLLGAVLHWAVSRTWASQPRPKEWAPFLATDSSAGRLFSTWPDAARPFSWSASPVRPCCRWTSCW